MARQRNYTIDFFRFICAFLVITLHFPLPGFYGEMENNLARVAVPFFFMTSGYYVYDFDKNTCSERIIKQIKNISKLCFGGFGFYFIFNLIFRLQNGSKITEYLKSVFNLENIVMAIIWNKSSVCVILWFMYALLYATILIFLLISLIYIK